jgi:large subunit ribosomal protein L19
MARQLASILAITKAQERQLPPFRVGDTVRVHYRITEGDKDRTQVFQGTVIRKSGGGIGKTFSVRKRASGGVGVERIFPFHSPRIEQLEVTSRGRVRRGRLFYLRELQGKAARLKEIREGDSTNETAAAAAEA